MLTEAVTRAPRLPGRVRRALLWLLTAAAYTAARRLGVHLEIVGPSPTAWPGLGIVFTAAVLAGPWLATAPVVAAFGDSLAQGLSVGVATGLALATAGAAGAAMLVDRTRGIRDAGEHVSAFVVRSAAAAATALVMSAGTVLTLRAGGRLEGGLATHLGFWFLGGFAGIVIVSPFLRAWIDRYPIGPASWPEFALVLALAAVVSKFLSSSSFGSVGAPAYLVLPIVFWAALRVGRRGATSVVLVLAMIAIPDTAAGHGPFLGATPTRTAVSLMAFLLVVSLSGLAFVALGEVRDQAERRLRAREQRFRSLVEKSSDVFAILGEDGEILYESASSLSVLGYPPEELIGRNAWDFIHPDDEEAARARFAAVFSGPGAVVVSGARFRHRRGHWVDLVATCRNLLDDPEVGGIVVNTRDVTESRRAERELADAERRYRTLVERLPLVSYVNGTEPDAPPRYVSPQIEELLGYPLAAWYQDPCFAYQVIHPDDVTDLDALFVEDGNDSRRAEYRMIAADGRIVWVLDHTVTIRDADGEPAAVQGFLVDVTERRRLEEQLASAQRMEALGLLAGGVAHDFNNLLTAIAGYGELARLHLDEPERARSELEEVLTSARRAADLTRQLLAFGRRQVLEHEVVDVNEVVAQTESLLGRLLGVAVEVDYRFEPELWPVRADAGQLGQVLVNLAVNARDAMPDGGRLTISTWNETIAGSTDRVPAGEYAVLSVSDTGTGIDPSVRDHLFDPFFTTKDVGKGTGLGLAVVYGIVEQSRGHVVVDSEPGRGAEFRVFLPRTADRPADRSPAPAQLPRGSETVLLVEDEDSVRRLTTEMLERQGYRVVAASSPAEALDVVEPYALLLTDVVMPGMNGPDLAEQLAGRRPDAAVLFTSGYSGADVAASGALADRFLEKPFTLEQLAHKVRDVLDRR